MVQANPGGGACRRGAAQAATGDEGGAGQSGGGACWRGANATAPGAMKAVQANLAAAHAGETPIKASPPALNYTPAYPYSPLFQSVAIEVCRNQHGGNPGSPGPNSEANVSHHRHCWRMPAKGASTNEQDMQSSKSLPKAAAQSDPHSINRKVGRKSVGPTVARETQVHHGKGHGLKDRRARTIGGCEWRRQPRLPPQWRAGLGGERRQRSEACRRAAQ